MSKISKYQLVCGLEVHAELKTNAKMFCRCKNDPFGAVKPNIHTCPICLGMPGGLPVPNKKAIEWTIKVGLALNCKINLFSKFDRKNYFYPDLPKGYQISQYDTPFCYDGWLETSFGRVSINRIHLEEDTGKLQHTSINGKDVSLVDYNRGGVPLIEIVTGPDIKSAEQAKEYGKKLRQILRYLDVSDCDMEQGGMRLEANVSLKKTDAKSLPDYKVEVKNINSFRFMQQAIDYEITRHEQILTNGKTPTQETRGFNPQTGKTFSQRSKEEAEDYRYFPDPDIPPIRFSQEEVDGLKAELPELPDQKITRWHKDFKIETRYAQILTENREESEWLEELFALALKQSIKPNDLANAISNKKFEVSFEKKPNLALKAYQELTAVDDVSADEMISVIQTVMDSNPDAADRYKQGETKVIGFFMGQVLRELGKKVDSKLLRETIHKQLTS